VRVNLVVIAFDCANERFGHSIALRAFNRRRSRFKADVTGEVAGLAGNITTAVIGEQFNDERQAIDPVEPMLDGSHHQVTLIFAFDTTCGSEEARSLAITAVQGG
jgi:hypothetical protein